MYNEQNGHNEKKRPKNKSKGIKFMQNNNVTAETNEKEIDILRLIKAVWTKMWVVVLCAVICGAAFFAYAKGFITPKYSSSVMLYVNNSSFSVGNTNFSISTGQPNIYLQKNLSKDLTMLLLAMKYKNMQNS